MSTPVFSVITGDIVGSTNLPRDRLDAALQALHDGAETVSRWLSQDVYFTRHRGDGWQICLPAGATPLRAALAMRAALRRQDRDLRTRMAIATGTAEIPVSGDLNAATGPAFVASGQFLDQLDAAMIADAAGGAIGAVTRLAHHVSDGWTQAQARAVLPMLAPERPTQDAVAEDLGISRQAVRQALVAAGMPDILAALDMLETG